MSSTNEFDDIVKLAEEKLITLSAQKEQEDQLLAEMPARFAKNITAFKKYLPNVAKQFENYQPKSMQLTCAKSGAANLLDESTGRMLYGSDPVQQCREQIDNLIKKPQFSSLAFTLDDKVENTFIHTKYMNEIHDIYLKAQKELDPLVEMPDHVGSMIVFGIGLGYHLMHLLEDITIDHLYLCEPNCDWFYASLYVCDWQYLLETIDERDGYIYLHLGVTFEDFTSDFINELKDKGSFNAVNSVIYQHYPSKDLAAIIKKFSKDFHLVTIGWGFFDDGIISIAHDYANGQLNIPVLKKDVTLPAEFRKIPVFIVANGPSLDDTIDTIKHYQDDVIIFSCGSVIQTLLKHDIIPDFHLEVERTKFTYDYLEQFVDKEKMKKINFLTGNIMHPQCSELFKWTGMGFKPTEASTIISCDYIDKNQNFAQMKFCNPVVGNTGASFACFMGFEEIYFLGVDNGYKDPSHHHSKSSLYYTDDGEEKKVIGDLIRSGELEVEGNFGGTVFSTAFFNTGKFYLEHLLKLFPQRNFYNCSDGAKIKHTYPLRVKDILIDEKVDKSGFIDYIKTELFIDRNFNDAEYINWLAIEKFNYICDKLIGFIDKEFTSRAEIASAFMQQVRYLFSYAHTRYRHIYFMLEGSLIYVHSIFRMMLYGFADEQATVACLNEATQVFKSYLLAAKDKYQRVLEEVDSQECYLMDMFKEGTSAS